MYDNKKVLLIAGGGTLGTYTAIELLRLGCYVDVLCPEDKESDNEKLYYHKGLGDENTLKEIYGVKINKDQITTLISAVNEETEKWRNRRLKPMYVFTYADCLYVPIKDGITSDKKAVYVIIGVDANGLKEILGMWIDTTESATFWTNVFEDLKERGVEDILYMSSDGVAGFKNSLERVFPKTQAQRCVVHLVRNLYSICPKKECKEIIADYKKIYTSTSLEEANLNLDAFKEKYKEQKRIVKKAEDSMAGTGVTFVESTDDAYEKIVSIGKKHKCDIIIQRKLTQHAEYAKFNSSSVNTLRIYSILQKDGNAKIYSSVLRMGVGNAKVDNYGAGGVSCGINPDGTLKKYAYNKHGERTEKHPHSGIVFEGCKLLSYDKAVELVKKAHLTLPHFRSVSWDIAINEDGNPVLIEANLCRGSIDLLQLNNGPLFGQDTKEILDEVFNRK